MEGVKLGVLVGVKLGIGVMVETLGTQIISPGKILVENKQFSAISFSVDIPNAFAIEYRVSPDLIVYTIHPQGGRQAVGKGRCVGVEEASKAGT